MNLQLGVSRRLTRDHGHVAELTEATLMLPPMKIPIKDCEKGEHPKRQQSRVRSFIKLNPKP